MREILIGAVCATALMGAPAMAQSGADQDRGFYVGAELGAAFGTEMDQQMVPGATAGSTGRVSTDHELGLGGAVFAGYDFGSIRLEVEAGRLSAGVDGLDSSFGTGAGLATGSQGADGDVSARLFMANVLLDLGTLQGAKLFIGAGAGEAQVKASGVKTSGGAIVLDDRDQDRRFAWQAIVGARRSLNDAVDLHVRYRYFSVDEVEMIGLGGRVATGELTAHTLGVGLAWRF